MCDLQLLQLVQRPEGFLVQVDQFVIAQASVKK